MAASERDKGCRDRVVGFVLLACLGIVSAWYLLALRSQRPFDPFLLTSDTLSGFSPVMPASRTELRPVENDEHEPNIAVYGFHPETSEGRTTLVRLVHGYNMRDCMRTKGYDVELVESRLSRVEGRQVNMGLLRCQVWALTSSIGDRSVWVTSMLTAPGFAGSDVEVTSMPFPRVGVPDALGYSPIGFTWEGLKTPVRNLKLFLRAHWNKSRCDWLTAFGLKRPAWLQDAVLTLVTITHDVSQSGPPGRDAIDHVLAVHRQFHEQLATWGATHGPGSTQTEE